ncbi:hypothetical protein B0A48_03200 [Cryoendolithus antarcticus]|uniref:Uncharacterized protein n=1 Tax=Cryoendolithus antarcticus TaxID=1507870 RepID=A0A1V8TJB0_9PEZI|nr:hypothetical protein B0A48_03200 [Cryoendolithus antarcticus]
MPHLSHDLTQTHSTRDYNDSGSIEWRPWYTYMSIALAGAVLSLIIHAIIYTRRRRARDALSGQPRVWRSGDKIGQKRGPGFEPAYRVDDLGGLQSGHVKTEGVVVEQPARAYSPAPPGYDESVRDAGRNGGVKMTPARANYLIRQEELAAERGWAR